MKITDKKCEYCGRTTALVDSEIIYGRSYGLVYFCKPCDAWVGVHKGTTRPLGRLANAELREWKKKAHAVFDPIWKQGLLDRSQAYERLAMRLGVREIHIGESDIDMCKQIIREVPYLTEAAWQIRNYEK